MGIFFPCTHLFRKVLCQSYQIDQRKKNFWEFLNKICWTLIFISFFVWKYFIQKPISLHCALKIFLTNSLKRTIRYQLKCKQWSLLINDYTFYPFALPKGQYQKCDIFVSFSSLMLLIYMVVKSRIVTGTSAMINKYYFNKYLTEIEVWQKKNLLQMMVGVRNGYRQLPSWGKTSTTQRGQIKSWRHLHRQGCYEKRQQENSFSGHLGSIAGWTVLFRMCNWPVMDAVGVALV